MPKSTLFWLLATVLLITAPAQAQQPGKVVRFGYLHSKLMSYGHDLANHFRRAACYIDKIIKGASPAELPVERPAKFQLIINLETAKQIGLTIPDSVLGQADRVIR